jgi:hypothetical protein
MPRHVDETGLSPVLQMMLALRGEMISRRARETVKKPAASARAAARLTMQPVLQRSNRPHKDAPATFRKPTLF